VSRPLVRHRRILSRSADARSGHPPAGADPEAATVHREGSVEEHVDAADACIEIPMVGTGASLNVAVAGSLVRYRLAGMA
jgi:tRNA (guanosine-2'-O-)-methyltransferase